MIGWVRAVACLGLALAPGEARVAHLTTARDAIATFETTASADGTLTVEARSLALDVRLAVFEIPATAPLVEDDNGLAGTDAAAAFEARAGKTYRIEVRPADDTEEAAGEVEVAVKPGPLPKLEKSERAAADEAYWERVRAEGEARGDPALRVRGPFGLGVARYEAGDYRAMAAEMEKAAAVAEQGWGASDGRTGVVMVTLGLARYMGGDLVAARETIDRAIPSIEARYGGEDPRTATAYNTLGIVEQDLGDLRGARDAYEHALSIREKIHGADAPEILAPLANLAGLIDSLGDSEKSLALYRRALAIAERNNPPDSARLASFINNVAYELKKTGHPAESIPHYERALSIREAKLGPDHPSTATSLQNLGMALHETGATARAIPLLTRALSIREAKLGADHPDTAVTLGNLARVTHESGKDAEALPLIERALAVRRDKLGPAHPDTTRDQILRARVLVGLGRPAEAIDEALDAEAMGRADLRRVCRFLPESGALEYAERRTSALDVAFLAAESQPPAAGTVARLWDAAIRSRAIVLDEMARRVNALRGTDDPAVRASRAKVERAVVEWTRTVSGGSGLKGAALRTALDTTQAQLEAAERELAEVSTAYRSEVEAADASLAKVRAALPAGAALVAFRRYDRGAGMKPASAYAALVLPPGGEPALVSLGDAGAIDERIGRWRASVAKAGAGDVAAARASEIALRTDGAVLRERVWDPLVAAIGKGSRVVVVPDAELSLLPFGALPSRGSSYLVETAPTIQYVAAERDLLRPADPRATGALALGGPAFDGAAIAASRKPVYRGAPPSCESFRSMTFAPLPLAAREAQEVVKPVAGPHHVLTDAAATEAAFKELAPANGVVHLATHGFVVEPGCIGATDGPLRLSGLALAGANRRSTGGDGEDGVLTAEEIASLDLSRVSWVALSACDTGAGTAIANEGVLGLRRAFGIAGARTLVLALWSVDDRDARKWMKAAYRARFGEGRDAAEAARRASLAVLQERRERGLDTGPIHWGGFVAAGP